MQVRKWPSDYFGEVNLVQDGEQQFVAEVLNAAKLPTGRTAPEPTGVWLSKLGTKNVVQYTASMKLCDPSVTQQSDIVQSGTCLRVQ
jgi:hypothetical protein